MLLNNMRMTQHANDSESYEVTNYKPLSCSTFLPTCHSHTYEPRAIEVIVIDTRENTF